MNVMEQELEGNEVLHEWCYFYSECVTGIHWLSKPILIMTHIKHYVLYGHRHDQTIQSMLHIRYNIPTVQKTTAYFTIITECDTSFDYFLCHFLVTPSQVDEFYWLACQ